MAVSAFLAALGAWLMARPADRIGDVPYVATPMAVVDRMLDLAEVGPGDLVVDLGSGDGRIVLRAASHYGARGRGIEIDAELVRTSRAAAAATGVVDRVEFVEGDLFEADLGGATAVTMFLLPTVNLRLRSRLLAELAPGTRVVSHRWDMAEWKPDRHATVPLDPPADVYQWVVPAALGGEWELPTPQAPDGTALASGPTLRLLQRFQEIDGELIAEGRSVPVTGTVIGDEVRLQTSRPHPLLGDVAITGRVAGESMAGRWQGGGGPSRTVVAQRRPSRIDGTWQVGGREAPFTPRWSMQWRAAGEHWTMERWGNSDVGSRPGGSLPGSAPAASSAERPEVVEEVYVWGSAIAFVVPAADGSARRVSYYGVVSGDRIDGVAQVGSRRIGWSARRAGDRR